MGMSTEKGGEISFQCDLWNQFPSPWFASQQPKKSGTLQRVGPVVIGGVLGSPQIVRYTMACCPLKEMLGPNM